MCQTNGLMKRICPRFKEWFERLLNGQKWSRRLLNGQTQMNEGIRLFFWVLLNLDFLHQKRSGKI